MAYGRDREEAGEISGKETPHRGPRAIVVRRPLVVRPRAGDPDASRRHVEAILAPVSTTFERYGIPQKKPGFTAALARAFENPLK